MIRYEVRLEVNPTLAQAVERYMCGTHIPEIMATGCFLRAHFDRSETGAYRTTYVAGTAEDFARYIELHFDRLRRDFLDHFPADVVPSRESWTALQEWP